MTREFRTILCPTDFSANSYHALDYALDLAQRAGGTLIVTHAIHVPAGDLLGQQSHTLNFDEAQKRMQGLLRELHAERLGNYPKCELLVDFGDPAEHILNRARDHQVDLIVISRRGRSGLAHLIMGSVAEKVTRHAPCPVLVVRAGVT